MTPHRSLDEELRDLVLALDHAERNGVPQVRLDWLQDRWFPGSLSIWTGRATTRQRVLADAIDRGLVVAVEFANASNPQQRSVGVRLDRTHPSVVEALDRAKALPPFHPVPIRGEPLSETIIRERR